MSFDPYDFDRGLGRSGAQRETVGQYTARTFLWMFFGLMITFATCLAVFVSGGHYYVLTIPGLHMGLLVVELIVVFTLARRIQSMSVGAARTMFLAYAVLNGLTFTSVLVYYGISNVVYTFALTAVYFGALAAYGYFTRADLSRLRTVLFSGLIFLVVAGVLLMFVSIPMLDRIVCFLGIAVFLGLTAYDTQKIKSFYHYYAQDGEMLERASIFCALQLYLDFINLFLYLLRVLGTRRR